MRNLGIIPKVAWLIASSTLLNVVSATHALGSEVRVVNECSLNQSLLLSQESDQPPLENVDDVSAGLVQIFDELTRERYSVSQFLSKADEDTLFTWIAKETSAQKAPYCYRRSYGRGVGTVPTQTEADRVKIGALSYSQCPPNTRRVGFDCHSICPEGMRDDGLYCRLSEYGRGAGYVSRSICNRNAGKWGVSECEKYGLLFYPKCRSGYTAFGSNICRPEPPDCNALGLGNRLDLSCAKKVILGDATPLMCEPGKENDAGLCYPTCRGGFHGVGPVCWQNCNEGTVNCGAGCASSTLSCTSNTASQVLSSTAVFANLGKAFRVSERVGASYSSLGTALDILIKYLRTNPGSTMTQGSAAYSSFIAFKEAFDNFVDSYEENMEDMTTKNVVISLKDKFGERGYKQVVRRYAVRYVLMSFPSLGYDLLKTATLLDPTGVTFVVAAYAQPLCDRNTPFPSITILSKD